MHKKPSNNLAMLQTVAQGLLTAKIDAIFVGGVIIELYITDPAAPALRPTEDVDCVIPAGIAAYSKLEEKLTAAGFRHATEEGAPACRWKFKNITVDIMPTDEKVLGFANLWYDKGAKSAVILQLPDGPAIRIFPLAYLLASKFEAFNNRGSKDWYGSKDLEDIIALLDGVLDIEQTLAAAPAEVRKFLGQQFSILSGYPEINNILGGFIPGSEGSGRAARCLAMIIRLKQL